jgi:hypothetical protein
MNSNSRAIREEFERMLEFLKASSSVDEVLFAKQAEEDAEFCSEAGEAADERGYSILGNSDR